MEIGGSNTGASTYAMKKAMEMPKLLLNLVQQTVDPGNQVLGTETTKTAQTADLDTVTGKGKIINIVA
jgi:hypothetical protein